MKIRLLAKLAFTWIFVLAGISAGYGQLYAPGSSSVENTQYPVFEETDNIFVFCTNRDAAVGSLLVETTLIGTKTFNWQKYNEQNGTFEFYFSESKDGAQSSISNLENGCFQVTVTLVDTVETYRAWVMNNWIEPTAEIGESNCSFFQLEGSFEAATLSYYDLTDNSKIDLLKNTEVVWKQAGNIFSRINSQKVNNPPAEDTEYEYFVSDRFGCEESVKITYQSIVTEASFTITLPNQTFGKNEAPLEVTFNNTSINGDADKYEWFFFKDLSKIKREAEQGVNPIDSIMDRAYNENPIYTYENTGEYMVKLVSKKRSELHTCTDTFYLGDYIVIDTMDFLVPNVFTPNGDGVNDELIVKFFSMMEMKIQIFNRWGRVVHVWEKNNIRGFENTFEESVWDGRIGNKIASPGVYYYMIEGVDRSSKKRRAHGFVHVFAKKE